MKKQTAVEWLIDAIRNQMAEGKLNAIAISDLKMLAKAMEKEQIIEAHGLKREHGIENGVDYWITKCGLEYYDQTYK
jgi:hypothetical protein